MIMKTYSLKKEEVERNWFLLDATDRVLGRVATKIADRIRGKDKPTYTPHTDGGDYVIVVNSEKINMSGKKITEIQIFTHTGYPGGCSEINLAELRRSKPERIIEKAVRGMLPHNRLGRSRNSHLKVYSGPEHPHSAQQPKILEL